jgi:hypothetical protein
MKTLLLILLGFVLQTLSFGQSLFQEHKFSDGITIKIPTNWKIIDSSATQQFDTNTEAKTGNAQGDNKILLAANLYMKESAPSATARLSVRKKPTATEQDFEAIPDSELQAAVEKKRDAVERSLRPLGYSVSKYSERREKLAGHSVLTTSYISAKDGRNVANILSILFLGDRIVKLHVTYDEATENITKATIDRIRSSLIVSK